MADMKKAFLSRQYLESVSTADLLALADDYGIDIPSDLSRRFIIGELLEVAEEIDAEEHSEPTVIISNGELEIQEELPLSYNETQIRAVLRNPAWLFVFWDIHQNEKANSFFLRVSFFEDEYIEKTTDTFDMAIQTTIREQYVFIPAGKKYVSVDLCAKAEQFQLLASTSRIAIPEESDLVLSAQPGKKLLIPPLVELSGMDCLLRNRYRDHREAFLQSEL